MITKEIIPWAWIINLYLPIIALICLIIWRFRWKSLEKKLRWRHGFLKLDKLDKMNSFSSWVFGPVLVLLLLMVLGIVGKFSFFLFRIDIDVVNLLKDNAKLSKTGDGDADSLRWMGLTFFGLLTALAGIIGVPLAIIRVNTTERQTRISEEDSKIKKREHTTSLLNQAIMHLGANLDGTGTPEPNIPLRIGRLIALEHIARDNIEDYYVQIMDIICAYIRNNTFFPESDQDSQPPAAKEDIRVAIDILADRTDMQMARKYRPRLDFANLTGVDFVRRKQRPDFSGVSFRCCWLVGAKFPAVNLSDADLTYACLKNANLKNANLEDANLEDADLEDADISFATLYDVKVSKKTIINGTIMNHTKPSDNVISQSVKNGTRLPSHPEVEKFHEQEMQRMAEEAEEADPSIEDEDDWKW